MRRIDTEIDIAADADAVWAVVADLAAYAEWNPFIVRAAGEHTPGERLVVTLQPPGHGPTTIRPRVAPPAGLRELRWRGSLGVPGLFDGEHVLAVEPRGPGRARFHHHETFSGLLVPLVSGMLRDTARGFEAMNRALKERVERGAARS